MASRLGRATPCFFLKRLKITGRFILKIVYLVALCCWMTSGICFAGKSARNSSLPEWAKRLFPAGKGRTALRCESAEEIEGLLEVVCSLQYPDVSGNAKEGKVKFLLPLTLKNSPTKKVPLLHVAGYECDRNSAKPFLAEGIAISTPHGPEPNPVVRGENLDVAILHRVRALPFVDDAKVCILGMSAGGYMTLMLAAETFPLSCAAPIVPAVNLGYNLAYFERNHALATARSKEGDYPELPTLSIVSGLAAECAKVMQSDFESDAWLASSPFARMSEITCPTLIVCSTADLLVPIQQIGTEFVQPFDRKKFPKGFAIDMKDVVGRKATRATLMDVLPREMIEVFRIPCPDNAPLMKRNGEFDGPAVKLEVPFSKDRLFSLVVIEEGGIAPQNGHTGHAVFPDERTFFRYFLRHPLSASQVTERKLRRLLLRYSHREAHPAIANPPGAQAPFVANRLDFPEAEKADVLRSLRTFASNKERARRLQKLYRGLPDAMKVLGKDFAAGSVEEMLRRLK